MNKIFVIVALLGMCAPLHAMTLADFRNLKVAANSGDEVKSAKARAELAAYLSGAGDMFQTLVSLDQSITIDGKRLACFDDNTVVGIQLVADMIKFTMNKVGDTADPLENDFTMTNFVLLGLVANYPCRE